MENILHVFLIFDCFPENIACSRNASLVRVRVHAKCYCLVGMPQLFGNAGNIRTIGNCNAGKTVAEHVRMQSFDAALLPQLLDKAPRRIGV